jgi:3-oxoacyl-[acyl-carrier-protein] synthase I
MTRLFLSALGVVNALGEDKTVIGQNLFAGSTNRLGQQPGLLPSLDPLVGFVDARLPDVPEHLQAFDCRNNRLVMMALEQISDQIDAAVQRYGGKRTGVVLGTSTAGIADGSAALDMRMKSGSWPNGFKYTQQEKGNLAEFVAQHLKLDGPAYTIATACSSSGKAMAAGRRLITSGICDVVLVGGCDTLCSLTLHGFHALGALAHKKCNPFSVNREGITIGEGAAVFLLSAEPSEIELAGIGETSDAHHFSAPAPDGHGAIGSMKAALDMARLSAEDIVYLNLHGTATPLNDLMESHAVNKVFGTNLPCSSTKSLTGHMLGAAAAGEAAFMWLSLHPDYGNGKLPPHIWDGAHDPEIAPINLVSVGQAIEIKPGDAMLSNSFAFGGSNVSVILARST